MKLVYFGVVIHYGGGPQAVVNIARRLSANHEVHIVDAYGACQPYLDDLRKANILVHTLVPENKKVYIGFAHNKVKRFLRIISLIPVYLKLMLRLHQIIQEINPDVAWMNIKTSMLFWALTPGLRRIPVVRSVIECRSPETASFIEKWCLRKRMDRFIAVSTETAEGLEILGIPQNKIRVVSDTHDFEALVSKSQQGVTQDLPGKEGFPKIVVPSTLLKAKGQHTAIKAMKHLKCEGLNPVLWLAGDVVGDNMTYFDELQELVDRNNLSDNVFFLGWRDDIPAIMAQSDIIAFPTHSEGFGLVVLEGFLLKKPVVTTWVGGIKDQVQDGVNASTFPVDDDRKMAACIKTLVENEDLLGRLVDQGYRTACEKFSPQKNTEGYISVFEETIISKKGTQ